MRSHFKKYWHSWILVAVMFAAFFIRTWQLEETLYFKMDQARDAAIAYNAHEQGPGKLTLLGPRAAGTFLRLGPVFYYFQYLSTLLSGSIEPQVMVYPELLFSILGIPLLYYFLRQFFERWSSLLASSLYGLSFIAIQYSRFAWNPNQTPFWGLLFLLGVYKSATVKDKQQAGWWLVVAAFGYGVVSQLHFTMLLALPVVAALFWIFYRPRQIKIYFWVLSLALLAVFYLPMLLSELSTGWDNTNQFRYALSAKGEDFPITLKAEQSLRLHAQYFMLALSSYGNHDDNMFVYAFMALVAFALIKSVQIFKSDVPKERKAFLFLVWCVLVVFGLLYTKLAFTVLKPRFWLLNMLIPYVFLALLFEHCYRTGHKKRGRIAVLAVTIFLLAANLYAVGYWYWTLANQRIGSGYVRQLVLKQDDMLGLAQMRQVAAHMKEEANRTGKQICYYTGGEYRSPYEYIFRVYHPEVKFKRISFSKDTNDQCTFFSIENGGSTAEVNLPRDHQDEFEKLLRRDFGVIAVWVIERKPDDEIVRLQKNQKDEIEAEVLDDVELDEEQLDVQIELQEEDEIKKPRRKERVFWQEVFSGGYEN